MSEMTPVAWQYRTQDGSHCVTRHHNEAQFEGVEVWPLYTADQLAEAVAAERERCVKVCEESAPKGDYSILGNVGDALRRAAEAIRSAAK